VDAGEALHAVCDLHARSLFAAHCFFALPRSGGLREVFPAFMGSGTHHTKRLHGGSAARTEGERASAIIAELLMRLPPLSAHAVRPGAAGGSGVHRLRVVGKFREDGYAKVGRLVELWRDLTARVDAAESGALAEAAEVAGDGSDPAALAAAAQVRYLAKLDAGLGHLQSIGAIVATLTRPAEAGDSDSTNGGVAPLPPALATMASEVAFSVRSKAWEQGLSLLPLAACVDEWADVTATSGSPDSAGDVALLRRMAEWLLRVAGVVGEGDGAATAERDETMATSESR